MKKLEEEGRKRGGRERRLERRGERREGRCGGRERGRRGERERGKEEYLLVTRCVCVGWKGVVGGQVWA